MGYKFRLWPDAPDSESVMKERQVQQVMQAIIVTGGKKNGKGKKIRIFKYTPKKGYRKRQGHRQPYTKVEIGKISF